MNQPLASLSRPSLRSHLRALWIITLKDWRHFWRYPLNAASRTFEPLVWLTPLVFLGRAFSGGGEPQGFVAYTGSPDYVSFILVGAILNNFILAVFFGMGFSLKNDMDTGVLEANWLAPLPRLLLLVGRSIASVLTTAVTSSIMLALAALVFGFRPSGGVLAALATAVPILVGLYGFGFAFAALVLVLREANTLTDTSQFVLNMLAGSNFPVQALPGWLLPVSLALPLTYGLDAVRGLLLNTRTLLPIWQEVVILVVFMFIMLWLGRAAFTALERRVRQSGTLGTH